MKTLARILMAGGLVALASTADAQINVQLGRGGSPTVSFGQPAYGYNNGYAQPYYGQQAYGQYPYAAQPAYRYPNAAYNYAQPYGTTYSSGYSGYVAPRQTYASPYSGGYGNPYYGQAYPGYAQPSNGITINGRTYALPR